jgi:O-antigen/teichoic acid export membrane protein
VAVLQAAVWVVTTAVSLGLVFAGWGLYALAIGWSAGQQLSYVACALRLRTEFPEARAAPGGPGRSELWGLLRSSLWVSLAQIAQVLTNGTDLLIAGWLLGPTAVVSYSCTTKLLTLLNNQCYIIGLTAQPALAHLGAAGDSGRLHAALRAVGLAMLAMSGAAAIAVATVNQVFVAGWVGPNQYAGTLVTLLAVTAVTARHVGFTWWNAVYIMGHERQVCGVMILDGVVTVAAVAGWTALLGLPGIPLGSLTGAALVYLPTGLVALAGALGISVARVLGWLIPWATRFALVFGPVAVAVGSGTVVSVWSAGGLAAVAVGAYALLAYDLAGRDPLRGYRDQAVAAVRRNLGWLSRASGNS